MATTPLFTLNNIHRKTLAVKCVPSTHPSEAYHQITLQESCWPLCTIEESLEVWVFTSGIDQCLSPC